MNNSGTTIHQGGVVEELLKTPVFKDILRNGARNIHYAKGSDMVRTVMGQDPEVFLNLMSAIPGLLNVIIRASAELGTQLKNQYPPVTLIGFLESMLSEIDTESLKKGASAWKDLIISLLAHPETKTRIITIVLSSGPTLKAHAFNALFALINSLEKERPGSLSTFMKEFLTRIDPDEASKATQTFAGAILDQKWHIVPWVFSLAKARIIKRFGAGRT